MESMAQRAYDVCRSRVGSSCCIQHHRGRLRQQRGQLIVPHTHSLLLPLL
jgi:hypothetical protein